MKRLVPLLLGLGLALVAVATIWKLQAAPPAVRSQVSLQVALSDQAGDFATVVPGREFKLPADHGEHPEFKTEWWYFTGNLESSRGRHGYQLTLFRSAAAPSEVEGQLPRSQWQAKDLFMGHLALSDVSSGRFSFHERFARRSLGLAGVEPHGERIWLEDWTLEFVDGQWQLAAAAEDIAVELVLNPLKPFVLQGDDGYSRKGPKPEHASYYVAQTRLQTSGEIEWHGERLAVKGLSWFDHEWSSAALAPGLVGWDWFSLQLDDGRDIMLYLLRYEDGRLEPASSGSVIDADGKKRPLRLEDFEVTVLDHHKAPSGLRYPSSWSLRVESLNLKVKPLILDQEMGTSVPYWEGAVEVSGDVSGHGFVEMTGYDSKP